MSFVIIGSLIAVSTATQIYGQLEAGKDQEAALKTQAEQERVAAESRELERQQKLNKALAANAVGMGMSGIKAEAPHLSCRPGQCRTALAKSWKSKLLMLT